MLMMQRQRAQPENVTIVKNRGTSLERERHVKARRGFYKGIWYFEQAVDIKRGDVVVTSLEEEKEVIEVYNTVGGDVLVYCRKSVK